ncbi:Rne/Rng family ribonuclease [Lederbergia wuyishanensis]|uniref:Ribonuclease G n=1 Tax=Lederbergia wuyishanensis TaxID=1347903 RepID=A0ABU0D1T8_9BACI|nr:Rne/Rng family ribonuclease [Lederbergia wuyishanensis]MCJ8006975.1 Rne/Rng family ribonuclease [Lederbergia wuyishanensis]MDQ0342359.1 ribonuclease G [Lederbergia wuyishanensis]
MNEIIIDTKTAQKRFAVKENGKVTNFYVESPNDHSEVGNIYLGKVESVKKGMNAAFVDIGKEKKGFLQKEQLPSYIHSTDPRKKEMPISKFITEGEKLLVQVKKDETGVKGPLLTAIIEIPGEKLIYMPEGKYIAVSKKADESLRNKWREIASKHKDDKEGFIIRTEAFTSSKEDWEHEVGQLKDTYASLQKHKNNVKAPALLIKKSLFEDEIIREMKRLQQGELYFNDRQVLEQIRKWFLHFDKINWNFHFHQNKEGIFSKYGLESELEKALKPIVWLNNGAYIVINETEAAIVIDVNTGKFTGKQAVTETVVQTNMAAAKEIARQVRLRDYSGMILIDFIDMKTIEDKRKVQKLLEELFKKDPKQTRIIGFTPLGVFEVTRKRTRQSLSKTLQTKCPSCNGKGLVDSAETVCFRLERELFEIPMNHEAVLIEIDKETMDTFKGEGNRHLVRIEEHLHINIIFKVIQSDIFTYHIRQFGTVDEIKASAAK